MTKSTFYKLRLFPATTMCRIRDRGWALVMALILCCASFVARAHSGLRLEAPPSNALAWVRPASPAVAQGGARGPVQVVQFAVYDVGIYPYEARVSKGLIAITFEDMSGGASDLVVERETGAALESIGRVLRTDRNARGRNDLRLEPGRYQLFVASHPENRATLIVEP